MFRIRFGSRRRRRSRVFRMPQRANERCRGVRWRGSASVVLEEPASVVAALRLIDSVVGVREPLPTLAAPRSHLAAFAATLPQPVPAPERALVGSPCHGVERAVSVHRRCRRRDATCAPVGRAPGPSLRASPAARASAATWTSRATPAWTMIWWMRESMAATVRRGGSRHSGNLAVLPWPKVPYFRRARRARVDALCRPPRLDSPRSAWPGCGGHAYRRSAGSGRAHSRSHDSCGPRTAAAEP